MYNIPLNNIAISGIPVLSQDEFSIYKRRECFRLTVYKCILEVILTNISF